MTKRIAKITALILLSVLLILPFSACKGENENENDLAVTVPKTDYSADSVAVLKYIGLPLSDIQADLGNYSVNPCADGGNQYIFRNGDYSFSSHSEAEQDSSSAVKTVYILARSAEITPGVRTGGVYSDYASNQYIPSISTVAYNEDAFAYSCAYPYEYNGVYVTVWLYFNSPDGTNTGAVVTTETFNDPSYEQPEKLQEFLLQCVDSGVKDTLAKYSELAVSGDYNSAQYCTLSTSGASDDSMVTDETRVKGLYIIDSKYEILPGFFSGKTYEEYIVDGLDYIGEKTFDEVEGNYGNYFVIRVGAANVECRISYGEDNTADLITLICKQRVN